MCQNANKTAASLMAAIRPTISALLTLEGVANSPQATAALAAYDAAETAVQNWTPGTATAEVLEVVGDLQVALQALPIPAQDLALLNIILAGVETVLGVIQANSPALAPSVEVATPAESLMAPEDVQVAHQLTVAADTTAKVSELVPGFKRSIWHSPESQYKGAWNKAVDGKYPDSMKAQ